MMYKLMKFSWDNEPKQVIRNNDNGTTTCIPFDPANTDYQAYLAWLAEGNEPEPAEGAE
jgi:hypothetical protein